MVTDSFCPYPWNSIFINHDGGQRFCCHSNILPLGILDFNHENIKKIRLQILNGSLPPACSHCIRADADGSVSPRKEAIKQFPEITPDYAASITKSDGQIQESASSFYITLGNKCNLKCMMCSPGVSSSWSDEDWLSITNYNVNNIVGYNVNKSLLNVINRSFLNNIRSVNFEWYNNQQFVDSIIKTIYESSKSKTILVRFSGGEITTNPAFVLFLNKLKDISDLIKLEIITNGTSIPQHVESLMRQFNVNVLLSLDGIGTKNDYIRYPSKFSVIDKNIKRMKDIIGKIFITITSINMFDVLEVIEWCEERELETQFNMVYGPMRVLCPLSLPKDIRLLAAEKLKQIKVKYTSQNDINDLIMSFTSGTSFSCSLQDFVEVTKRFDIIRGTNLLDIFPEWNRILNEYRIY
jgi:MoaA/NifB/PqqE/SkfB family radical SAM enzyme